VSSAVTTKSALCDSLVVIILPLGQKNVVVALCHFFYRGITIAQVAIDNHSSIGIYPQIYPVDEYMLIWSMQLNSIASSLEKSGSFGRRVHAWLCFDHYHTYLHIHKHIQQPEEIGSFKYVLLARIDHARKDNYSLVTVRVCSMWTENRQWINAQNRLDGRLEEGKFHDTIVHLFQWVLTRQSSCFWGCRFAHLRVMLFVYSSAERRVVGFSSCSGFLRGGDRCFYCSVGLCR